MDVDIVPTPSDAVTVAADMDADVELDEEDEALSDPFPDLDLWFTNQPPSGDQIARYQALRRMALDLAGMISSQCGRTPESKTAMDRLRETVMWANCSIAVNRTGASMRDDDDADADTEAAA